VAEHTVAIGVEVAVDSVAVAAVGLGGRLLHVRRRVRDRSELERIDVTSTIDEIARMVADVEASLDPHARIVGAGVGVVGLVRRPDRTVTLAPNLGWREVRFGDLLDAALGARYPLSIANDADLAALAELRRGRSVGVDDVINLWGEVGVGGGIVSEGRMITGASGFAGEVGHMTVNPDGRRCGCGSVGCWETEVGEDALLRRAGRDESGGRVAVDAVLAEAAGGDPVARRALALHARWLGIGIAGLVNIFNPSLVVLGGLFERLLAHVGPEIDLEIRRRAMPDAVAQMQVVGSALGAEALLLGGAELAFDPLFSDPIDAVSRAAVAV
jgi:predicted NBD/HSP70 family sugar kinase